MQTANLGGGGNVYFTYDSGGNRVRKVWDKTSTSVEVDQPLPLIEFIPLTAVIVDARATAPPVMPGFADVAAVDV